MPKQVRLWLKRLGRWIAIRTGAYPAYIIKRFVRMVIYKSWNRYRKNLVDNVYSENVILKILARKGSV